MEIENTFVCAGCGHELPAAMSMRTPGVCYLCDQAISLDELLDAAPTEQLTPGTRIRFVENYHDGGGRIRAKAGTTGRVVRVDNAADGTADINIPSRTMPLRGVPVKYFEAI